MENITHGIKCKHVFNDYMIYKSTGHSERQQMHKKAFKKNCGRKNSGINYCDRTRKFKNCGRNNCDFLAKSQKLIPQFFLPLR